LVGEDPGQSAPRQIDDIVAVIWDFIESSTICNDFPWKAPWGIIFCQGLKVGNPPEKASDVRFPTLSGAYKNDRNAKKSKFLKFFTNPPTFCPGAPGISKMRFRARNQLKMKIWSWPKIGPKASEMTQNWLLFWKFSQLTLQSYAGAPAAPEARESSWNSLENIQSDS